MWITEYGVEIAGQDAGQLGPIQSNRELSIASRFLNARAATIYGGTTQVQKNILAQALLGLPTK